MCVELGSNGLECATWHSFTVCVLGHPGGQRRGSYTYAPEAHSPLAHTHPKPGAGSYPGSPLMGMGGWVCNPSVLRFGQIRCPPACVFGGEHCKPKPKLKLKLKPNLQPKPKPKPKFKSKSESKSKSNSN